MKVVAKENGQGTQRVTWVVSGVGGAEAGRGPCYLFLRSCYQKNASPSRGLTTQVRLQNLALLSHLTVILTVSDAALK